MRKTKEGIMEIVLAMLITVSPEKKYTFEGYASVWRKNDISREKKW